MRHQLRFLFSFLLVATYDFLLTRSVVTNLEVNINLMILVRKDFVVRANRRAVRMEEQIVNEVVEV